MYTSHLKFAPASDFLQTSNKNEALLFSEKLKVFPEIIHLSDIKLNYNVLEEGSTDNVFTIDGKNAITRYGFEKFCKILHIPPPFAGIIPLDLLYENIKRLTDVNGSEPVTLLRRENGEIASVAEEYDEVPYADTLSSFLDKENISHMSINEVLMKICFKNELFNFSGYDNVDADILYHGIYLYSSILKETKLHIVSGLYRSVCDNSYIMPCLGKAYADMKEKDHSERLLELVDCMDLLIDTDVFDNLKNKFPSFVKNKATQAELLKTYNGLKRVINPIDAMSLLKLDDDLLKLLKAQVSYYNNQTKQALLLGLESPLLDYAGFTGYELANIVTFRAKEECGVDRLFLENLGGKIIQRAILN